MDEAQYTVGWTPRPAARLWQGSEVIRESHNGSHIKPPVCEGTEDHIDLELTGEWRIFKIQASRLNHIYRASAVSCLLQRGQKE